MKSNYIGRFASLGFPVIATLLMGCSDPVPLAKTLPSGAGAAPGFPLKVSEDHRFLVEQDGKPFFIRGDSPWDLSEALTVEEVRFYCENRKRHGFNTVLVTLIADTDEWVKDSQGRHPFDETPNFRQPNEEYWKHVDEVLAEVSRHGFLVVACPTWLGAGKPRWRDGVTPEAMREFGPFLVKRYGAMKNLIWLLGGDRNPEQESEAGLRVLAGILHEQAPHQLITYHGHPESSGAQFFQKEPWYLLNAAYSYRLGYEVVRTEWKRTDPVLPVWLAETGYDGEDNDHHDWQPREIRKEHWWAATGGACGTAHGAKQVWRFGKDWRDWLDRPATKHISLLHDFMSSRTWWKLAPDLDRSFLVAGAGVAGTWDVATAALASDGSWGVVFLPSPRALRLDLAKLTGAATAHWFDPTSGESRPAAASTFQSGSIREFTPPGKNADGDDDWLLVLQTSR